MEKIAFFYPENHALHHEPGHPERPERVEVIRIALQRQGWWEAYPKLLPVHLSEGILQRVHSPAYLNLLEISCRRGGHLDMDTYLTPASWGLALAAAGGAAATAQAVWHGEVKRGFALTRPPGHHASRGQGMGFCLLNNISLAAETLIQTEGAKRLAIIDLDLHHGNGTQDIFYQRQDVLYISIHQSPLYPGSGALEETGSGEGKGYTVNFPLPPRSGDTAFSAVMIEFILPLLNTYLPEMIMVSFGFDAHWSDPLGHLLLSAEGYTRLIRQLADWADSHSNGRIALFLEGGYNLDAAAACSRGAVAALLGIDIADSMGGSPYAEGTLWRGVLERAHRLFEI